MKIAVDVMGTDFGSIEIISGAIKAIELFDCEVVLVGNEQEILENINKLKVSDKLREKITVNHAEEVVLMSEHPSIAVKKKKNSSIVLATKLLKEGVCQAVVSPGNTGAAVASALLVLGRIKGVERPSIATPIPNRTGTTVVLDSGANVDSKPKHMVQGAIMGSLYAKHILNVDNPRVGLLNIGAEETKGNEQALQAYPLLANAKTINFVGNAEGRDVTSGDIDVLICDGFVGNVLLKFAEGLALVLMDLLRDMMKTSGILTKFAAMLLVPALKKTKKKIDVSEYGGAPLLGVNGVFIICHGSSKSKDISNAIRVAISFYDNNLLEHIETTIRQEGEV